VTGSIGVAGGWLHDAGLKEQLGISTDVVTAGPHADLGFGLAIPLIGPVLPDRNLSGAEKEVRLRNMEHLYELFLEKAARHRGMSPQEIGEPAGGRIWTGAQALQNGLADRIGGLSGGNHASGKNHARRIPARTSSDRGGTQITHLWG